MFSRHGGKAAKAQSIDSADGGTNPQAIARYKNQAAKAREKIVDLVKERDKIENDYNATMNKNEFLTDERDALVEERNNLLTLKNILQKERDSAVAEKDEAVHELGLAAEAKDWAINDMKNAKEDAEVQRRAKDKASKEAQALKNTVTRSVAEKKQAKQELMATNALLTTANFDNRKANGDIKRLKQELEDTIQEMKQQLNLAALNLQRTRALGEDRESELNRWVCLSDKWHDNDVEWGTWGKRPYHIDSIPFYQTTSCVFFECVFYNTLDRVTNVLFFHSPPAG